MIEQLKQEYDSKIQSVLLATGPVKKELVAEAKAIKSKIDKLRKKMKR